jgi:MFS family permease
MPVTAAPTGLLFSGDRISATARRTGHGPRAATLATEIAALATEPTTRRAADPARTLAGAVLGSATGISAILLYTNGLFVGGLTADFALTRAQFGLGVLLVTIALAAANPIVGWAVDRFSPRWPSVAGLLMLSAGFAAIGTWVDSTSSYLAIQALVAFFGAASGPIAYTKFIGAAFTRRRGLALGLTMTGIGLSAAIVPPLLAGVIAERGWRAGYFALALVPLAGAVLTALILPGKAAIDAAAAAAAAKAPAVAPPAPGAPWIRSRVFWTLAGTFALMSLSFGGLVPHFVPLLTDGGLDPVAAGRVAGQIGLAVIASRLAVGWLLDRVFAPWIAISICLVAAAGSLAMVFAGIGAAPVTAIAVGLALGAELDLMGFLVARYFGLANFGRIYGWQYCAFILASGMGPLWIGAVRDATGDYTPALVTCAVGLCLTCLGFLQLPRYATRPA